MNEDNASETHSGSGKTPVSPYSPPILEIPSNGLAIAAFILGLVSVVSACACGALSLFIVIPFGVTGIVLSVMSRKRPGQRGMGTAGLVLSICGVSLSVIMTIFVLLMVIADESSY